MYFFYSPFFIPNSTFTSPLMLSIYKCYGCWMRIGEKIEYRKLTELFNKIDNLIGCIKRPPFFYLRVDFTGFIRVHRVWKWPPKVTENCENWKKNGILIAPWLKSNFFRYVLQCFQTFQYTFYLKKFNVITFSHGVSWKVPGIVIEFYFS